MTAPPLPCLCTHADTLHIALESGGRGRCLGEVSAPGMERVACDCERFTEAKMAMLL